MRKEVLAKEARDCGATAPEFVGRPEAPFLLKLAEAFERLARQDDKSNSFHP